MQCEIILLKIVITLSNILFVKAEQCKERIVLLNDYNTLPKIKTCYLEYSCSKTIWNTSTQRWEIVPTRPTSIHCCRGHKQTPIIHGKSFCIPICKYTCVNGICTEPNTCTCNYGYAKSSGHQSVCIPNCEPACIRGKCIAPNTCQCNSGYEMSVNNKNRCDCKSGFKITKRGVCIPVCEPECDNGECIGPNNCKCSLGYQLTAENTCKPICKENCIHGYCMNGNCECDDDWFGPVCNSTTSTQNYNHDSHHRFPIEIGLSFTVLVLAGISFLLYKKHMFHCQRKTHDTDLDNFMVNNSIYGWVPK
ncbi:eater [Carabus blaptoides fortunei]